MNAFDHAHHARELLDAVGSLEKAATVCRIKTISTLSDYQNPHRQTFMPADVIFALERYVGRRIYSRALFEAGSDPDNAADLLTEACEAAEVVVDLQREIRIAARDGRITPNEHARIARLQSRAADAVRDVAEVLARNPDGGAA